MATDSFAQVVAPVATKVSEVEIILKITDATAEDPKIYAARYTFDRRAADDSIVDVRSGNLVPHLTGAQLTQAKAFMDAMLAKAKGSI